MKLNDKEYMSDEQLEVLFITADEKTKELITKVLFARKHDKNIMARTHTKPKWGTKHPWTPWEEMSEGSIYDRCKYGVDSEDYYNEIEIFETLVCRKESDLEKWLS